MPRGSFAHDAVSSFLPEQFLALRGDEEALALKYEAQREGLQQGRLSERLSTLVDPDSYDPGISYPRPAGQKMIDFDGVSLETGHPVVIDGYDHQTGHSLNIGSYDASMLHVERLGGAQHFRQQLGHVASYIMLHKSVRETPIVLGVTYREMARLGKAVGMREMELKDIDEEYESYARAKHRMSFARQRNRRPFEPAAVYLPTEEFIDRFYV